jgi:hypothetical protein
MGTVIDADVREGTCAGLNPRQQEILEGLLGQGSGRARPAFRADLALDLHAHLERSLAPSRPDPPHDTLGVTKHDVAGVLGCEVRWQGEQGFDGWSVEKLAGTVVHRAIEQHAVLSRRSPVPPLEVVERVLAWMEKEDKPRGSAAFLRDLDPSDRVDLVHAANNGFTAFVDHWPPIDVRWRPRFEQWSTYDELFDGTLQLRAKHDLAFGQPSGTTARTVIVDVKTGSATATHQLDNRFYALVETLRARVPPFRVASYYTRSGRFQVLDVTEELLFRTADVLADAVRRMWELGTAARLPRPLPSGLCAHHCPFLDGCEAGRAHVAERDG